MIFMGYVSFREGIGKQKHPASLMEEVKVMKSYEHFLDTCHIDDGL